MSDADNENSKGRASTPGAQGGGDNMDNDELSTADILDLISGLTPESYSPQDAVDAAKDMAAWNLKQYPKVAATARSETLQTSEALDAYMSDRFWTNLERVLPDWEENVMGVSREALTKVKGVADQLITGELPDDVKDQILRYRAELGLSQGLFGQAANAATARDLGRTSYDLMMQGVGLYTEAVSPLSARLLSNAMALQAPTTDPAALFQTISSQISGVSAISPTAVLQTTGQIGLANAQLAWDAKLSGLNATMDMWTTQQNNNILSDQISASKQNALVNAFASAGGSALGFAALCDSRFKKNIKEVRSAQLLDDVLDLKVVEFEYKPEVAPDLEGQRLTGVLADEVRERFKFGDGTQVSMVSLVGALIGAVQELTHRIKALEEAAHG